MIFFFLGFTVPQRSLSGISPSSLVCLNNLVFCPFSGYVPFRNYFVVARLVDFGDIMASSIAPPSVGVSITATKLNDNNCVMVKSY